MCPSTTMDNNIYHHDNNNNKHDLTLSIPNLHPYNHRHATTTNPTSTHLEIRLFYVRIAPCLTHAVPDHLTLTHHHPTLTASPTSPSLSLRRDRVDKDSSEVTYVSTDNLSLSSGILFNVSEEGESDSRLLLCGSLERMEAEWSMDCYPAGGGTSSFCQPKMGISSPTIEVYIAGRWGDVPVILTKVVNMVSPRRKSPKYTTLDSIPEVSDAVEKDHPPNLNDSLAVTASPNGLIRHRKLQLTGSEDEYVAEGKIVPNWYQEEVYVDEDSQLSWFNAGVRVGVGIGLGMCLGVGIGVGLLMRSYQTTTRNFRRRFF